MGARCEEKTTKAAKRRTIHLMGMQVQKQCQYLSAQVGGRLGGVEIRTPTDLVRGGDSAEQAYGGGR